MSATTVPNFRSRLTDALNTWLRRDGKVILLFAIATIVMTYPIAVNLNGSWVASYDTDTYMKLWDNWWFTQIIHTGQPLNFTPVLFYPIGLDLTFHSISWTVSGFNWLLTPLLGSIGAYNFSILFAVFATAYGGYLLLQSLGTHRAAAWLGGAVYSFIPYHITHSGAHPDLGSSGHDSYRRSADHSRVFFIQLEAGSWSGVRPGGNGFYQFVYHGLCLCHAYSGSYLSDPGQAPLARSQILENGGHLWLRDCVSRRTARLANLPIKPIARHGY